MKNILVILADGFEETEAVAVIDVLRRLKLGVTTAGLRKRECMGTHWLPLTSDAVLAECKASNYDAVFLPGGLPGATTLYDSVEVGDFLNQMNAGGKIVSAICAAPIVLAKAGLLNGRVFTMYPGFEKYLNGLKPTGKLAERHGNIVTGKGPGAVWAFSRELALALGTAPAEINAVFEGMFVNV